MYLFIKLLANRVGQIDLMQAYFCFIQGVAHLGSNLLWTWLIICDILYVQWYSTKFWQGFISPSWVQLIAVIGIPRPLTYQGTQITHHRLREDFCRLEWISAWSSTNARKTEMLNGRCTCDNNFQAEKTSKTQPLKQITSWIEIANLG